MIPPGLKNEIEGLKEVLTALMVGGVLAMFKTEMNIIMRVFVGIMTLWYITDITQRIEILMGGRASQMDLQLWYILVDFTTFSYVLMHGFIGTIKTKFYRFLVFVLGLWFLRYLCIDIMDTPEEQNNSIPFHFMMMTIDVTTIGFMLWTESVLYRIKKNNNSKTQ